MKFQDIGGNIINDFLKNNLKEDNIYDKLEDEFKKSFAKWTQKIKGLLKD